MIKIDTSEAQKFITANQEETIALSKESFDKVINGTGKGSEWLGWRTILTKPNDALLEDIDDLASNIRETADIFIVCGIGGSYLGAKAMIDALFAHQQNKVEVLYIGHHMSGSYLKNIVDYISKPKEDGSSKSIYLNVISKSGTTLEPGIAFRVLRNWMNETYGKENANSRIICTTSPEGGALNKIIKANNYKKFEIPNDVGGRFSVLTPVGLLPLAVAGVDVKSLFYGAVSLMEAMNENQSDLIDYVSTRYGLYKSDYKIDIIASFEPELLSIGGWLQQLYGESEGKQHNGLYPTVHGYSTDLHSLGQMVQDGERNLFETFLTVATHNSDITVPGDDDNFDELNYVAGKSFNEINQKAFLGTKEAHIDGGVPVITIELDQINSTTLGELIYFFEMACAVYVYNLDVNPFDQPGVEAYKKAMFRLLGK